MQRLFQNCHREPYPAIEPTCGSRSQNGSTVLITGASKGIGLSIAKAFALASASRIVLLGRDPESLSEAIQTIQAVVPQFQGDLVSYQCNIATPSEVAALWDHLAQKDIEVDVLVLNAGTIGPQGPMPESSHEEVWKAFEINTRGNWEFAWRFYQQNENSNGRHRKVLLNISTALVHERGLNLELGSYAASKTAFLSLVQQLARDIPVEKMQIISFHPGYILTDMTADAFGEDAHQWDDADLPGHFAVWAASKEAAFLHGRFAWANWDVNVLKSSGITDAVGDDPGYLQITLKGL